jgi:3-oxoacyl-[acyl-carrier protein] reductase
VNINEDSARAGIGPGGSQQSSAAELTFAQVSIGSTYEVRRTFTQDDIAAYARLSGDFSPLHVSPEYACTTEFGDCVVHGMLLASLFSQLIGMHIPGKHALYLGQDMSFRKPVLVGETVTASAKVTGKNDPTRTIVLAMEIRNGSHAVVASGTAKVKVRDSEAIASSAAMVYPAPMTARRVAVVTGGSRGIGAAIAARLARAGFAVVVNYNRGYAAAQETVEGIRSAGGEAIPLKADVRNPAEVERMVNEVVAAFGIPNCLVNCATGPLQPCPFVEMELSSFEAHLEYQVKAVAIVCKAVYSLMKKAGGGAIVNILSQVTSGNPPGRMADYVTAKYALLGLSKALAIEWAEDQIRVNTVSPSLVQTEMTQHYPERVFKMEASRTPLRRLAETEDVANAVAFLLGPDASYLTGVNLFVTGGQVMN